MNKWIPVSERLPEKYVDVLVTYMHKENTYVRTAFLCSKKGWCTSLQHDLNVVAWMPLPKPYEEVNKMNQENKKSLQEKKDSIDGCIGHLTIAIQESSDHSEFK